MDIQLCKPFMDEETKKEVLKILDSGWYILGENTKKFEEEFAKYIGVKHAVATSSGTTAIFLVMKAFGIKSGDEVIIPSFTFISTGTAVISAGGKLSFVDIDEKTYNMDPSLIEERITKKTKAIMPVHFYGNPVDVDSIKEIAEKHDLKFIEDACQAHGAEYKGKKCGSFGDAACFSFYPSKVMTVGGDGGMVVTNDDKIAEAVRLLRDHGRIDKYCHKYLGFNMRFNEIQAVIGRQQLKHLDDFVSSRRKIAEKYTKLMKDVVITPIEKENVKSSYYVYTIRTKERDKLQAHLKENNIPTGIYYPISIHEQPCINSNIKLPKTEKVEKEILSLPMHPFLKDDEIKYISEKTQEFFR